MKPTLMLGKFRILKSETIKEIRNKIGERIMAVSIMTETHEEFSGDMSKPATWLTINRGDSVAILLLDSRRDEIVLVEQFRAPLLRNIFELVAGMKSIGESAEDCVVREVEEEVALEVKSVRKISEFYLSPGILSEQILLYYAEVDSLGVSGLVSGLEDEGENIRKHVVTVNEAMHMMDSGEIDDAKTIIALQWLRNERIK